MWMCPGVNKTANPWWAVEDDGPGIAPAQQARVFERFERGTAAQDVAGSGLGLAIAREVAHKHGGTLRLDVPASGHGCRFVMTLVVHTSSLLTPGKCVQGLENC